MKTVSGIDEACKWVKDVARRIDSESHVNFTISMERDWTTHKRMFKVSAMVYGHTVPAGVKNSLIGRLKKVVGGKFRKEKTGDDIWLEADDGSVTYSSYAKCDIVGYRVIEAEVPVTMQIVKKKVPVTTCDIRGGKVKLDEISTWVDGEVADKMRAAATAVKESESKEPLEGVLAE